MPRLFSPCGSSCVETGLLVIEIQRAVAQPHIKSEDELRYLAETYANRCEAMNRQLSQAIDFVRKGFRGEAARLVRKGNLIAEANALCFPERKLWSEIAAMHGITTSEVAIGLARELETGIEAYAKVQPLVDRLRFLNVRRASRIARATVLQKLLELEPGNSVWKESLERLQPPKQ